MGASWLDLPKKNKPDKAPLAHLIIDGNKIPAGKLLFHLVSINIMLSELGQFTLLCKTVVKKTQPWCGVMSELINHCLKLAGKVESGHDLKLA